MLLLYQAPMLGTDSLDVSEKLKSASVIRSHVEWICVTINHLMINIVKETERDTTLISKDKTIDFAALKRINNVSIPQALLFADSGDTQPWILRAMLDEFKTVYGKILNNEIELNHKFEELIDTREQISIDNGKEKKLIKWEQYYFGQKSEGEVLITLLRIQLSVNQAESILLSVLQKR